MKVHTIRVLLHNIFGLSFYDSFEVVIDKIRKSAWFMGKTATVSIEDLTIQVLEYATMIDAVNDMFGNPLPIGKRFYLSYMCHMIDLDPHGLYGLKPIIN